MRERVIVQGYGSGTVVAELEEDQLKVELDDFDAWVVCPSELCAREAAAS